MIHLPGLNIVNEEAESDFFYIKAVKHQYITSKTSVHNNRSWKVEKVIASVSKEVKAVKDRWSSEHLSIRRQKSNRL